jgi:hypothetical protein
MGGGVATAARRERVTVGSQGVSAALRVVAARTLALEQVAVAGAVAAATEVAERGAATLVVERAAAAEGAVGGLAVTEAVARVAVVTALAATAAAGREVAARERKRSDIQRRDA